MSGPSALLVFALLNWVIVPTTFLLFYENAFLFVALCLAASSVLLVIEEWRRVGHPLTPVGLVGLTFLVIFSLRPMAISSSGVTTAGAAVDTRTMDGQTYQAGYLALVQVWLFICVFGSVYFALAPTIPARARGPRARPRGTLSTGRCGTVLVGCIAIAALCALLIVVGSGGFSAYLSGLSVRSSFLAGRFYLTLGYIPLAVALYLYVLARRAQNVRREWDLLALTGLGVLVFSAFLTGARGPLMLTVLIPIVLMRQLSRKPLSTGAIVLIGVGALAASMVMSVLLRDNVYDGGQAVQNLGDDPLGFMLDRLTSGMETRPFDSLIVLNEAYLSGGLQWQLGVTYLAVGTWFLPSSIAAWKTGGGNAWFTETYLPRFYFPDHIETSISAIGEAFANFGWIGIVAVAGLLSTLATRVVRVPDRGDARGALLYVLLTPFFFSFVRGDAYQNLSVMALMALLAAVFIRLGREPAPGPRAVVRHVVLQRPSASEDQTATRRSG